MLINWKDLKMTDGYQDISPESPRGILALVEYRQTDCIWGILLCSKQRFDECGSFDDPSTFGPSVLEIDWSGFPG